MDTSTLNQLWRNALPVVKHEVIVADREFYNTAADLFTITVVPDETDKWERPYETVIEQPFASQNIAFSGDLVGFFLHVASHQKCDTFWQQCNVPMDTFPATHLDFIEEVYNQRLVSVVAPSFYDAFPSVNTLYDQYKGFDVAKRIPLQTMFTRVCDTGIPAFDAIHMWLYNHDPLKVRTFQVYMTLWRGLLQNYQCGSILDQYES